MSERKLAVQVQPIDNVASIFAEIDARRHRGGPGPGRRHRRRQGPSGHSLWPQGGPAGHCAGETVVKYGESIGIATANIKRGDYVHVHNLDSARARGDWKE